VKSLFWSIVCLVALNVGSAVDAQQVRKETPLGEERAVPVGGTVWESVTFAGAPGVVIAAPVQANWGSLEVVNLPAGSSLIIIREKKLKACRARTITRLGGFSMGGWADCLIDKNQDGSFERVSFNEVGGSKNIDPPVSYTRELVPVVGAGSNSFRKTLTFLGISGDNLRLSYREFSNDMARPAFTEDLTLPTPIKYPQTILVKEIKLTVLGIDSNGLRFRLD